MDFPSFKELLSLINQLSDADKHRLSQELNKAVQSRYAQLTEVDNPRSLLALLRSWNSLEEDFPDIDESLLSLDDFRLLNLKYQ